MNLKKVSDRNLCLFYSCELRQVLAGVSITKVISSKQTRNNLRRQKLIEYKGNSTNCLVVTQKAIKILTEDKKDG